MVGVEAASAQDLAGVRALLEGSGLPTADLASARPEFAVIRQDGRVVAAGALQHFGAVALLRSVVVAPECRGGGLGGGVLSELERRAQAAGMTQLILLTQTAEEFFARRGFSRIERSSAPRDLQASEEFRSLCPSSAICMAKSLSPPERR